MNHNPKLRRQNINVKSLYPLNSIPEDIIIKFFSHIVYLISIGNDDLTGDDISIAFAKAIDGTFHKTRDGLVDVSYCKQAWSIKTVKHKKPFQVRHIRLISGRNNVLYSYKEEANLNDIVKTGEQVVEIWNARVDQVRQEYTDFRTLVVVRSNDLKEFVIFEEDTIKYTPNDYTWISNSKDNLIAVNRTTKQQTFTWQPNGSQFTIHKNVPVTASKYALNQPEIISEDKVLENIGYNKNWVHFMLKEE